MPIYEYVCRDCGKTFDALRSMKDADRPIACARCGCDNTTRKPSVCNAQSGGRVLAGSSGGGCGGCSGGSCSSCGHH